MYVLLGNENHCCSPPIVFVVIIFIYTFQCKKLKDYSCLLLLLLCGSIVFIYFHEMIDQEDPKIACYQEMKEEVET